MFSNWDSILRTLNWQKYQPKSKKHYNTIGYNLHCWNWLFSGSYWLNFNSERIFSFSFSFSNIAFAENLIWNIASDCECCAFQVMHSPTIKIIPLLFGWCNVNFWLPHLPICREILIFWRFQKLFLAYIFYQSSNFLKITCQLHKNFYSLQRFAHITCKYVPCVIRSCSFKQSLRTVITGYGNIGNCCRNVSRT